MAWELRRLSDGQVLHGPVTPLPENWGPIFGLHGVKEDLGDLSWVGLDDQGWFEVEPDPDPNTSIMTEDKARKIRNELLAESDWAMVSDVPMTSEDRDKWVAYRAALRDVPLQRDFPTEIMWPTNPIK